MAAQRSVQGVIIAICSGRIQNMADSTIVHKTKAFDLPVMM